jgi:hypothetical protein
LNARKVVPENCLKKQERDAKLAGAEIKRREQEKKDRKEKLAVYAKNAEKYFKEHQKAQKDLVESKRKVLPTPKAISNS